MLQDPKALDFVPVAVDFEASDLATPTPTTCSTECPNNGNSASVRAVISFATPSSSSSTGHVRLELAADVVCDHDTFPVDASCDIALPPTNFPTGRLGGDFGMSFLASEVPHTTLSKTPPTAATVLGPTFTVQVQISSSTVAIATAGMDNNLAAEVFLVRDNMISNNHEHSEAFTVKVQEKVLRPIPWPSFNYHLYRVDLLEPRSCT